MKKNPFLFVIPLLFLLGACSKDASLSSSPNSEPLSLELRTNDDCVDLSNCTDFSNCNDLVGTRPFSYTLLSPPVTFSGQQSDGVPPVTVSLCSDPANGHPLSFRIVRDAMSAAAVRIVPQLGRVQLVEFDFCVRPYILPDFVSPPGFTPGDYPVCGTLTGDWTFTGANGDQLNISIEATTRPDCDDLSLYLLSGSWIVTGGTGRFEEATGGGCLTGGGWGNFFTGPNPDAPDLWLMEGGIDY